ncbi:hypothetical protein [uncultured Megamonas sp.]|uniref:hypothetical protein n=1 Tax=uncultured Megamonas sp. TaxID=286140 RepID=UPI00259BC24C|nr:hypothetical protein [uncultured Megamonas sp.]
MKVFKFVNNIILLIVVPLFTFYFVRTCWQMINLPYSWTLYKHVSDVACILMLTGFVSYLIHKELQHKHK